MSSQPSSNKPRPPKPPRLHKMTSVPTDIPSSPSSSLSSSLSYSLSQNFPFVESCDSTPPSSRRPPPDPPNKIPSTKEETPPSTPPTNRRTPPSTPPTNRRTPPSTPPTNKRIPPSTPPTNNEMGPSFTKKLTPPPTPPNKPNTSEVPPSPSHSSLSPSPSLPPPLPPNKPSSNHLPPSPSHSSLTPSSSLPPSTSPFKPNDKSAVMSTSTAAANIVRALNRRRSPGGGGNETIGTIKEDINKLSISGEEDNNKCSTTGTTNVRRKEEEEEKDNFVVVDNELNTQTRRTVSLIGNQLDMPKRDRAIIPSKPKPIPSLSSHREVNTPTSSVSSSYSVISSSSSGSVPKRPLLPPTIVSKSPSAVSQSRPLPRPLERSSSSGTPPNSLKPPRPQSQDIRSLSHIETRSKRSMSEERGGWREEEEVTPLSPSSVSSGIQEDDGNLSSPNSRQTTPSCITCSESVLDELTDTRGSELASIEEIDAGGGVRTNSNSTNSNSGSRGSSPLGNIPLPARPPPPKGGVNQFKVKLKKDNSWIQRTSESPPTSPPTKVPPPTPAKPTLHSTTSVPYRSHAIINLGDKRQSSVDSLLQDPSRPMIGPSGQYYPPAVRSITPEPPFTKSVITKEMVKEEKEGEDGEEGERGVSVPRTPKRFLKYRRSNSFSGETDKKIRPVSMVEHFKRDNGLEEPNGIISESTIEEGKQARKFSPKNRMSVKDGGPAKKKGGGVFGLFKSRQKIEENGEDDRGRDNGGDSSEDETGGTIKRMPKNDRTLDRSNSYVPEYPQLFQYVKVLALKEDPSTKKLVIHVTYQFPPPDSEIDKEDKVILDSIGQFCFPDIQSWKPVITYKSETFSFVLTNIDGSRRFGYCRRLLPQGKGPRLPEVFCIISPLGCFDLYSKILDIVEERRMLSDVAVFTLLKSIIANPFPAPGQSASIKVLPARDGTDFTTVRLRRPPDSRLEHVEFCHLYNTLGPKKLIKVFSSLLMERRVVLTAQRLSTLSSCGHALLALLYPFEWQHTFIPVLPNELIDFCASPLPYIIGISPVMVKKLDHLEIEMEEALVVDLDKRRFVKKFGDEASILPNKVSQYLTHMLEATVIKNEYSRSDRRGKAKADEKIVNSFMTVFAYFFGEYKRFMVTMDRKTGIKELQKKEFVDNFHSKSTKRFLRAFMLTQMFDKWIEERENPHKSEAVAEGLFEKKLPELKERIHEIEIFSSRRRFPWQRRH